VVFWSVRNDTVGMKRRTSGLLAMDDAEYAETLADQLKAQQAQQQARQQAQEQVRSGTAPQQPGPGNPAPDP